MAIAAAVLVASTATASAQNPPPRPQTPRDATAPAGSGVIEGTVTAVGTGRPVRRARVAISGGDPRVARSVIVDDRGAFAFTNLPAGQFTLSASRPGYLDATFGQKRPGSGRAGTPIEIAAGQHLDRLNLQMPRGGVITGLILDEYGDTAPGATVRALRYVRRNGERVLDPAATVQSDDRGVYRLAGLLPGDYLVNVIPRDADQPLAEQKVQLEQVEVAKMKVASAGANASAALEDLQAMLAQMSGAGTDPANEPAAGYAPVYYPGTTTGSAASVITLDIGEEKTNIDLQLQVVPLGRVTGTVASADGALPPGTQVILIDAAQVAPGQARRTVRSLGPDGKFTFTGIPQGAYTLVAKTGGPVVAVRSSSSGGADAMKITTVPTSLLWASADVTADGRAGTPVTLLLQPGVSVSGRLVFDGTPPTDLTRVRLSLTATGDGVASELSSGIRPAGIDADGRFTFVGAVPGRYRLSLVSAPQGWSLKSAVAGGQDALDIPLEVKDNVSGLQVTATMRTTSLSGTLQGIGGDPASDYTVVVFSSDSRFWLPLARRIQAARPSTTGRFSFRDLPPGEYRLAAVSDAEPGQWFDPAFLRSLVGASVALTLGDGESKVQDLRLK